MEGLVPGRSSLAESRLKGSSPPDARMNFTSSNFFLLPVTNVTGEMYMIRRRAGLQQVAFQRCIINEGIYYLSSLKPYPRRLLSRKPMKATTITTAIGTSTAFTPAAAGSGSS